MKGKLKCDLKTVPLSLALVQIHCSGSHTEIKRKFWSSLVTWEAVKPFPLQPLCRGAGNSARKTSGPHPSKPTTRTQRWTIQNRAETAENTWSCENKNNVWLNLREDQYFFSMSKPQPGTNRPYFRIGPLFFYENKCLSYCHKNHPASINESLFPMGIIPCTWTLMWFWCF